MKKRKFLKTTGAVALGSALTPLSFCTNPENKPTSAPMVNARKNWAGNLQYSTENFHQPKSIEQIQSIVKNCTKVRTLGTAHCFNGIADSKFNQVSVRSFDQLIHIDEDNMTATIGAGASYGQICQALDEQGFALHNLASLPHISVAGAMATATHGSGVNNGNLGSAVASIEFVDAQGELQSLSRDKDGEMFSGMATHLGGLGVITELKLDLMPRFEVVQHVFQYLPLENLMQNFREVMSGGYSVSLFTDYQSDTVNQVWVKSKVEDDFETIGDYYGAQPATKNLHPIVTLSAENCTDQMGVPGPWYDRLPHFKMNFTPSSGKELQSEFFVPIESAPEAYEFISSLKEQLAPVLMISEIRSIAADEQWMSPFYQQQSVSFHFTWEQDKEGVEALLPLIQNGLEKFKVRPHWGKVFTIAPERIRNLYPNLEKFKSVLEKYDPNGKFRNEFLETLLYS